MASTDSISAFDCVGDHHHPKSVARDANNYLRQPSPHHCQACDVRLAILAHELRSPLQVLSQAVERLTLGGEDEVPGWLESTVERQRRALARLSRLLDGVLEVCRLESGVQSLRCEVFDMSAFVREQLAVHDSVLSNGCGYVFDGPGSVLGSWDRLRVELALSNLLGNAVRYAGRAPIEISVSADPTWASISVRDHGPGIPLAEQQRIFEPFVRGRGGASVQGTGLGLWLVNTIARAHGGEVKLTSAPGEGATFALRLPRAQPEHFAL